MQEVETRGSGEERERVVGEGRDVEKGECDRRNEIQKETGYRGGE